MRRTNRPVTVIALMLGLFMAAMEMTVVSTAMPTAVGDLGGLHLYSWVFAAYMLASTVTLPIFGKLSDLYGRKPIMLFGISLFLIGSAASGQAQSMPQLIAFRVVQGLGAGAMQPIALTIIGDIFSLEERARIQGVFGAVWGLAGLVGPVLGGVIVKVLSWRWVFYVNLPFGILCCVLLIGALHENVTRKDHKLDLLGAGILSVAVTCVLAGTRGGPLGTWAMAASVVLLAGFIAVERRANEPVVPLDLFSNRAIAVSSASGAMIGGAMISAVTFIPLYVQAVMGGTPTQAGTTIAPMAIGWPLAAAIGGRLLPRVGFRPLIFGGLSLAALATLGIALGMSPSADSNLVRVASFSFGVGLGFANTSLLLAVQTSVPWERRGIATASTMFFRSIGGAVAVGAMGGVLAAALARDPTIPAGAADALLGPTRGRELAPEVLQHLSGAMVSGLGTVFWMIFGVSLAALVAGLFFPYLPMGKAAARAVPVPVPPAAT